MGLIRLRQVLKILCVLFFCFIVKDHVSFNHVKLVKPSLWITEQDDGKINRLKRTSGKVGYDETLARKEDDLNRKHNYSFTNEEMKKQVGNQKCKIPQFDAFHPQILPHVGRTNPKFNRLNRKATIKDGRLHLELKDVEGAGFYYIRRVDDIHPKLSEWKSLFPSEQAKGTQGCITNTGKTCDITVKEVDSIPVATCDTSTPCSRDHELYIQFGRIKHAKTGMCLLPDICIEDKYNYNGNDVGRGECASWQDCQKLCRNHARCLVWTYNRKETLCWIKTKDSIRNKMDETISGRRHCLGRKPRALVFSKDVGCLNGVSLFKISDDEKRIRHIESNTCVSVDHETNLVTLADCASPTTLFTLPKKFKFSRDLNVSIPLTEEFVKVEYVQNSVTTKEYLAHVLPKKVKFKHAKRTGDELNIVMIMIDSQSNKNIERQLTKTFKYLNGDPNTVILKNHVIVGDATTANLAPMLTGKHVSDLPEARPWHGASKPLDTWPLIFRDLRAQGFVSMYADDDPPLGGFQFRLKGFNRQPTDKYLLPFLTASMLDFFHGHQYMFEYLRHFQDTYQDDHKTFAFVALGLLGHGHDNRIHVADNDVLDIIHYLNRRSSNTAIFLFGDHGSRSASLRETIWGKLEERLPFMSITLPSWFRKKHARMMHNLKTNSHVLTSHFDIYHTLRHMISLNNYTKSRDKKGESLLLTNVARLNRTCAQVGIPLHYCPCTEFKSVLIDDTQVVKVTEEVVNYINKLLSDKTLLGSLCTKLKLKEILRAQVRTPTKEVRTYKGTHETSECDRCGISFQESGKLPLTSYEILLRVEPSQGLYEATVEFLHDTKMIRVNPEISRVNRYGDQPKCVQRKYPGLRKYCFCKPNATVL